MAVFFCGELTKLIQNSILQTHSTNVPSKSHTIICYASVQHMKGVKLYLLMMMISLVCFTVIFLSYCLTIIWNN